MVAYIYVNIPKKVYSLEKGQATHSNIQKTSLTAQLVKNPLAMPETWIRSLGWKDPWRREQLPTPVFWLGEFHGFQWGHKGSYTTVQLPHTKNRLHFKGVNFMACLGMNQILKGEPEMLQKLTGCTV